MAESGLCPNGIIFYKNKIAENLQKKATRASVLAQLRERKPMTEQQELAKNSKTQNDSEW